MNIVKSASSLVLAAALFAGCAQPPPPVEAVCAAQDSCGLLAHGETSQTCIDGNDTQLQRLHEDPLCVGIAVRMDSVLACASELTCPDLMKVDPTWATYPDDLPAGLPCRAEKVALYDELVRSKCKLPLDDVKQGCLGPDCPSGVLKMACDNRAVDGTCFDFTTVDRNDGVGEPFCKGTRMEERCPSAGTIGFCLLDGPAVGQRKLRYYEDVGDWEGIGLEGKCARLGGTYEPW